ncbi:hypothetical protein QBC41DRAFT_301197 [Cercophora samala]|uniref:Uncharacterized protein n=1 Tax=Cercophora samala TaxID=330535 RepID=A0AA40DBS5_9PEZI|nr:hypothetical protein QBC41DRAFT_301197 [Cercophora samala]
MAESDDVASQLAVSHQPTSGNSADNKTATASYSSRKRRREDEPVEELPEMLVNLNPGSLWSSELSRRHVKTNIQSLAQRRVWNFLEHTDSVDDLSRLTVGQVARNALRSLQLLERIEDGTISVDNISIDKCGNLIFNKRRWETCYKEDFQEFFTQFQKKSFYASAFEELGKLMAAYIFAEDLRVQDDIEHVMSFVEDIEQYKGSGKTQEFPTIDQLKNSFMLCFTTLRKLESDAAILSAVKLGLQHPGSLTMDQWTSFKQTAEIAGRAGENWDELLLQNPKSLLEIVARLLRAYHFHIGHLISMENEFDFCIDRWDAWDEGRA